MTATRLRLLLSISAILLASLAIASMWLSQRFLVEQVRQTDHAKIEAEVQENELTKLQKLQQQLQINADIVSRAQQVAANTSDYRYQDQVITDLSIYAAKNGLSIGSIDFEKTDGQGAQTKSALALSLRSPVAYTNFLHFIYQLEKNLTKFQITNIALAPDPKNPNQLLNPTINLEVYLRK